MSPRRIVESAVANGIDLIAIADHNSVSMVDTMAEVALAMDLSFLYGMELQTREDIHLLAYFDDSASCHGLAQAIYPLLPDRPNEPTYFGDQVIVDKDEMIVGSEPKLLVNSLDLGFNEAVALVREHGGLPVPAHVDRDAYGLIAQLGFVPEGVTFDLVETLTGELPAGFGDAAAICSSDAHQPDQIGQRTTIFNMNGATICEMILAAQRVDGRSVTACTKERRMK
jgi:3',5'-nucleoside bisphosphate phosphatase